MAHLARSVFRRGAALGGFPFSAAPTNAGVACRAMSTSWMAKSAGSVLGRHSVKVKGDGQNVRRAMDEIEKRERMLRIPEIMQRHRYHEKGFNKTRRQKARKKWRDEFRAATRQLNWMTFLKDRGVPIPGQKTGRR